MTAPTSTFDLQAALDAALAFPSQTAAAVHLGLSRGAFVTRLQRAKALGMEASPKVARTINSSAEIRRLETELKKAQAESADAIAVKQIIGDIASKTATMD